MYLSFVSGLLLIVMCDQVLSAVTHVDVENVDIETFARQRGKRSLFIPGSKVVKKIGQGYKLLRGYSARKILLKGAEYRGILKGANIYEKPGGIARVLKDYESIDPSNKERLVGPIGVLIEVSQVGNRAIRMTISKDIRQLHLSNPEKTGNGLDDMVNYLAE